jgi:LmbE family N-acetylglucosaminyl deacetylase
VTDKKNAIVRVPEEVPLLGTILGVWAHPDDEAYLAGGIMAQAVQAGNRVVCVTATRGELGTSDPETWPPERLSGERTEELRRSLSILGVSEHVWLDLPDGGCADVAAEGVEDRLVAILEDVQPRTVLTFGPDGMTGHPDHIAVSRWTTAAFERAGTAGSSLHFATLVPEWLEMWRPIGEKLNVIMDESMMETTPRSELSIDIAFPDEFVDLKYDALAAQTTQTGILIDAIGEQSFREWITDEQYRLAAQR